MAQNFESGSLVLSVLRPKPLSPYDCAPLVPTAESWGRSARAVLIARGYLRLKRATR